MSEAILLAVIYGCLDDIQTALKPLRISEKIEIHFYDHFGLAESFKTINRPSPTWPDRNAL